MGAFVKQNVVGVARTQVRPKQTWTEAGRGENGDS